MAPAQQAQVFHLRQSIFVVALAAAHGGDHDLAGGGQLHAARQAVKQRRADPGFQVEDLLVHGSRGEVQRFGCLSDRAAPGHLVKAAEGLRNRVGLGAGAHVQECMK